MVLHGNIPGMNRFRNMLKSSYRFQKLADEIYEKMFGTGTGQTTTLIAIHIRLEEDFKHHCLRFSGRHQRECYVSVKRIKEFIVQSTEYIPSQNFKVLILSGLPERDLLMQLSSLCEFNSSSTNTSLNNKYYCIYKEMLYPMERLKETDIPFSGISYAYLDYLIAHKAQIFFGNYYSSLSTELYYEFEMQGKKAYFYNQVCETKKNSTMKYEPEIC
jgi:hypothetical protein